MRPKGALDCASNYAAFSESFAHVPLIFKVEFLRNALSPTPNCTLIRNDSLAFNGFVQ
jgi:hypothetical protein